MRLPALQQPHRFALGGGATLLSALSLGWYALPKVVETVVAMQKCLKPGSDIRGLWAALPQAFEFKVFMFNVTNPEDVQRGAKPIVQEIGPYSYGEWKWKEELYDNVQEDTVSFSPRNWWKFYPKKSGGLTGDELVTIPHPLIVGVALSVERDMPGAMTLVNLALPNIHRNPPSVFLTAPVREILFDGVTINCTVRDFQSKALCKVLKKEGAKDFEFLSDKIFKFSFFGLKNNTVDPNRMTVDRGIRDVSKVGRVLDWKGKPRMSLWRGDPCNQFAGTDGTIFEPFLKKHGGLVAFITDICRDVKLRFVGEAMYKDVPVYRYTADLGDQSARPEEKCFCPGPDACLKRGAMDLLPCVHSPMVATLPHMLNAHEDYQQSVEGQQPDEEKHAIVLDFEPHTGTPMMVRKRLQFNMPMHPIPKLALMTDIPDALVPIFWVEEGLDLEDEFVDMVKWPLFLALKAIGAFKWSMVVAGAGLSGAGGVMLYQHRQKGSSAQSKPKITQVASAEGSSEGSLAKFGLAMSPWRDAADGPRQPAAAALKGRQSAPPTISYTSFQRQSTPSTIYSLGD